MNPADDALPARPACPPEARRVLSHVDDLGASHGANQAFLELAARGLVTCGSVMVPGPWFREIVAASAADPALDLGVHLTLTSEWDACRWAPISTCSRASGLIDDDGCFWRDVESLSRRLVPEAAEAELRAQIERAIAAGLAPTHIDAHMAAAMLPELLDVHVRLAEDYTLWPVLPRSIGWAPDPDAYGRVLAALDRAGAPVVDHCRGTLPVGRDSLEEGWRSMLGALPGGTTHLALHCTAAGDFAAMSPRHAGWREGESDLFASGAVQRLLAEQGIETTSTRSYQRRWQAYLAKVSDAEPSATTGAAGDGSAG